jgi:hypothetical protein
VPGVWISHHSTGNQWQAGYRDEDGHLHTFSKKYGGTGSSKNVDETRAALLVVAWLWQRHKASSNMPVDQYVLDALAAALGA